MKKKNKSNNFTRSNREKSNIANAFLGQKNIALQLFCILVAPIIFSPTVVIYSKATLSSIIIAERKINNTGTFVN